MQIDLVGPFTPSNGFTQAMTAIDVFTKYLFAAPLRRVTSQAVTHVPTQIFLKHTYIPKILLTDEGSQFTSKLMKDVTTLLDVELGHATVKHPQTIGLLERAHAGLKKTLKIYENTHHSDWHKFLDYAVFRPQTQTTTHKREQLHQTSSTVLHPTRRWKYAFKFRTKKNQNFKQRNKFKTVYANSINNRNITSSKDTSSTNTTMTLKRRHNH